MHKRQINLRPNTLYEYSGRAYQSFSSMYVKSRFSHDTAHIYISVSELIEG